MIADNLDRTRLQEPAVEREAPQELAPEGSGRPARERSLADAVEARIERMILTRELAPGEKINEHALSSSFQVSRGPIREACRRLEQMGLVVIVMNRGVFVRKVSLKEALDVYSIRAALSRQAGRILARRIQPEQQAELEALARRLDGIAAAKDVEGYFHVNLTFHARLMDHTGNPRLAALYQGLVKELHLFRWRSFEPAGSLEISNAEHKKMLDAIAAGDAVQAGRAFERHVELGKRRMLDTLDDEQLP